MYPIIYEEIFASLCNMMWFVTYKGVSSSMIYQQSKILNSRKDLVATSVDSKMRLNMVLKVERLLAWQLADKSFTKLKRN